MHYYIKAKVPHSYRLKNIWTYYAYIGIIVWICSTMFHSRDFWLTELLDYFSACGIIVYAMFASISFAVPWFQMSKIGRVVWKIIGSGFLIFYLYHIYSLWIKFDYAYNMLCCIVCSLTTSFLYLVWAGYEIYNGQKRKSLAYLVATIVVGLGSVLFEVFDFPPFFWIIDAHSLFHLATVPTPFLLAKFVETEASYEMRRRKYDDGIFDKNV
uniref:Post-GPI attachment to proteins factor 3 n=1 Tax=Acrobeloides nanus TaxID=290746 RepID=A0A914D7G3_9BILA